MIVSRTFAAAVLLLSARTAAAVQQQPGPALVISEVMADPRAASDAHGEWFEVHNRGRAAVSLRGWTIRSGNDRPHRIAAPVLVAAGGYLVLGRDGAVKSNGGVRLGYIYGSAISFANAADWLALSDPRGTTVDSIAWQRTSAGASWELGDEVRRHAAVAAPRWHLATTRFGAGDSGTPGAPNDGIVVAADEKEPAPAEPLPAVGAAPASRSELVVRVLDVGQGDATYIANGTSKVIIDGGPDTLRFGRLLDSLGLNGSTIDVVILSHEHYDHHAGLRELFRSSRRITVRY